MRVRRSNRQLAASALRILRAGTEFSWNRLGVRAEDFDAFDLLPLSVKKSDNRASNFIAAHGDRCAELDALPPTELRRRIESAIATHIDDCRWERLQRVEQIERETMQSHIEAWDKLGLDTTSSRRAWVARGAE